MLCSSGECAVHVDCECVAHAVSTWSICLRGGANKVH